LWFEAALDESKDRHEKEELEDDFSSHGMVGPLIFGFPASIHGFLGACHGLSLTS